MITNDKEIIWMEKYRPQRIEDLVLPDHYINSFKEYIKNPRNILLTSETPGTGKTSISNAIIKEGQFECLFINASLDNGIDTLRGKIRQFASSIAFNDKCKLVVLDECLEENEEVLLVNNKTEYYSPLKDLEFGKKYKCKSYNMEKNIIEYDTCELISEKEEEVFEVELEDGRKVLVTDNHPFIIREKDKITQKKINEGLKIGDDVVCRDDIINEDEFSCGNKECYYKSIKFYERDPSISEKQSIKMKEKIKNGEWTPKVTNSWFNRKNSDLYKTDNISFRSSWELYFYIYNKNRNISLEYEKVIIPYFDTKRDKNRNYLVDFIDKKNNILYEIKPNSEKQKEQIKNKELALIEYCKKNNLSFKYISEDWFIKNYDEKEFSNYQLDFKDKILKLLSQFRRSNENSVY